MPLNRLFSFLLVGFVFIVFTNDILAADSKYVVNKYTLPKEYNNSELFDMVRDRDGFIYLATAAGLMEWDGQSFKVYNSANTHNFLTDRIQNLYLTRANDLWLFRRNRNITLKRGDTFETFQLPEETGSLRMFMMDMNEQPWVLTNGMVYRFDADLHRFESFSDLKGLEKTHLIAMHPSGTQIFVTDNGLWEYRSSGLSNLLTNSILPVEASTILSIHFTNTNTVIVGHLNGYFSVDLQKQQLMYNHTRINERVNRIVSISNNKYVAYSNYGEWKWSTDTNFAEFIPANQIKSSPILAKAKTTPLGELVLPLMASHGGSTNINGGNRIFLNRHLSIDELDRPRFIYSDIENNFWIGTINGSIYRLREKRVTNLMGTPVGEIQNVYSILEAYDGSMWYGCLINGIFRENKGAYTVWNNMNSRLPTNHVRYLYQNPADSTIYAGLYHDGLWRFNNNNWEEVVEVGQLIPTSRSVIETMYYDPYKNRLLIGHNRGMIIKDSSGWSNFEPIGIESFLDLKVIRASLNGELFLGTAGHGITLLDSNDRHVWTLTEDHGLASDFIRDIYFQAADTLWVATENNGINRVILNSGRQVRQINHLGLEDGLSNLRIHRIISDDYGYLWISSNYGIMASKIKDINNYLDNSITYLPMHFIDENAGMTNPEANGGVDNAGVKLGNSQIAIPTQSGVVFIDPQRILNSNRQGMPRPIIREIRNSNNLYYTKNDNSLTLPLGDRQFTVFFQAPLFNDPDFKRVRYKLDGFDTHWRYLEDNFEVWYTQINPGSYQLNVEILNPYGSPEQTSIALIVPSYLFERLWFQIIATIMVILVVVSGTRFGYGKKLEINEIRRLVDIQTKELKKVNEEKSRFFASITHELKTPLSVIISNIDLMITSVQKTDLKISERPIKSIKRNSNKLLLLTDTLLAIAKLQNSQISLGLVPVNIVESTQLIVDDVGDLFKEKKLKVKWIIDPSLENETIDIDIQAWERIIVNILNNAINYSPINGLITIEIRREDQLLIEIRDEGPGIDNNDIDDIFEYFNQGLSHKTVMGYGLGLYLVRELVIKHGGTITAFNQEAQEKGACFQIRLPYTTYENNSKKELESYIDDTNTAKSTEINFTELQLFDKKSVLTKLLIVEDSDDYRDYLVSEFDSSYDVLAVSNGPAALDIIEEFDPDVIVSDVVMPFMSGFELINKIRQLKKFRTLPVIFLTALDSDSDTHTGLSAGADVFLSKPIKIQVLKAQVNALIRREKKITGLYREASNNESEIILNIKQIVYRHLGNKKLSSDLIAETLFISRATLYRKWGEENEISIQQYIVQTRLKEGLYLIKDKKFSITEAAYAVGFSDSRYFSTVFRKHYGYSPSKLFA